MSALVRNLIFDLGFHSGEDTDFYLKKGFSVVGVEANPELVADASHRFRDSIAGGRLHLIAGAIAPASAGEKVIFYVNPDKSVWGTIVPDWSSRNEMLGYSSRRIEVPRVDIAEVYRKYGAPFFLKIDVEGVDRLVLEELKSVENRPQYVSLESEKVDFDQLERDMELLKSLGYKKFKVVQQSSIPGTKLKTRTLDGQEFEYVFLPHSSGCFGDDLASPWLTYTEALEEYRVVFRRYKYFGDHSVVLRKLPKTAQQVARALYRIGTGYRGPLPGWFDTHASL
jgi:FkbM family methyltransferase